MIWYTVVYSRKLNRYVVVSGGDTGGTVFYAHRAAQQEAERRNAWIGAA